MTKYFVTGGAGFIGSHLVDRLVETGTVTVYDNLSVGKTDFIREHLKNGKAILIEADLLDRDILNRSISGHDIVFHMAANPEARRGIENTELDLQQETLVTYNVLEAMRLNHLSRLVFSSSGTIYGEVPFIPIPEDFGPALPISLYGAGKLASEGLISAFCGTFNFQAWIFRFANVIGPRSTHGVIYDFIAKLKQDNSILEILGDGHQRKPYIHVADCIDGILFALKNTRDRINLYNLGCDSTTDVNTIALTLLEEMGLKNTQLKYSGGNQGWPGDVAKFRCDIEKIHKIGWMARYSSDQAVQKAIRDILGKP